uniref:N-acetyltransferase n=1 Tax=Thermosporothrix sp. COM3 TaxID=2490863 RepID=A0A455SL60_9CHLR|nr:N-acetyltransferase [Thermosporothrix sp. COM3]
MTDTVTLREVIESDLPIFFTHQQDSEAAYMAAFTPKNRTDWDAFSLHWTMIRNADSIKKTILANGEVAGHILQFELMGDPVVGYWIGRQYWGRGIATQALTLLLDIVSVRPLYAMVAADNIRSRRVLEKCGFTMQGSERSYANERQEIIEELIFKREA